MSREAMTFALDALENHSAIKHPQQRYYRDRAIDALRAALDAYDQTALELCEVCGWKAIVPGDGCLVCAKSWIDITDGELYDLWLKTPAETEDRFAFVRKALAMQKEKNGG